MNITVLPSKIIQCIQCKSEFNESNVPYGNSSLCIKCQVNMQVISINFKRSMEERNIAQPMCPFCYNGTVVEDVNVDGIFFCESCFREIKILRFKK